MAQITSGSLIRTSTEISPEWLRDALGRSGALELLSVDAVGTGQMSQSYRTTFREGAGEPESVVVKLASADPTSRATGVGMKAYWREVSFYAGLAGRATGTVPNCHLAAYDDADGWFTLVLEDIRGAHPGDQIAGCAVEQARLAVRTLARLHAPMIGDLHVGLTDFLNQPDPFDQDLAAALLPGFLERYAGRISPEHEAVCRQFVPLLDAWKADRRPPFGLVHGDYRLDNLLFADGRCTVVDWQTVSWGSALHDLSYFIGGALDPEDRHTHEQELVRLYHDELVAAGVHTVSAELCWEEYRRQAFHGLLMTIIASMVVQRTDRGDDMFMGWFARAAQQILDLGSLDLLPTSAAAKPAPLRPDPVDEGSHQPGTEAVWNESWYFDAISDDGSLGMYTRIGRVPNQGHALFTASIVGPGRPSIMLVDPAAPLPDIDDPIQLIDIAGLRVEQHCEEPLRRFRVTLTGTAQAYDDHSAPLRGERGVPVDIAFDLLWETDGVPYQWRQSTRYEIPCRVSGTIRVGDEEITFAGPGQRDHSWAARDWHATDWMWHALHLDDGTHTHAVGVPQMPGYGVGYVQTDGRIEEIETLEMAEEVAGDGLITDAEATITPGDLRLRLEPVAFGAIRLEAPDGRVSHFPRAMCRVHTADGRTGAGWVEWNRNQPGRD